MSFMADENYVLRLMKNQNNRSRFEDSDNNYEQRPLMNANGELLTMDANGNGKRAANKSIDAFYRQQKQDSDVSCYSINLFC